LQALDNVIKQKTGTEISVYGDVNKILSKKWMGSPEKRDTPLYNLHKNYGYNLILIVDFIRNGGKLSEIVSLKRLLNG
jgi:hypothetical protein